MCNLFIFSPQEGFFFFFIEHADVTRVYVPHTIAMFPSLGGGENKCTLVPRSGLPAKRGRAGRRKINIKKNHDA